MRADRRSRTRRRTALIGVGLLLVPAFTVSAGEALRAPGGLVPHATHPPGLQWLTMSAARGLTSRTDAAMQEAPPPVDWPRWQARWVALPAGSLLPPDRTGWSPAPSTNLGLAAVTDLYWSSSLLGPKVAGGFRATTGWLLNLPLSGPNRLNHPLTAGFESGRSLNDSTLRSTSHASAMPYLGLGYTGLSTSRGWGLTADLGVLAANPGALRLSRQWQSSQAVEELLREIRLTPVVRLGISYEF